MVEKNEDSDSSSLPSLDEQERETENAKDEKTKDENTKTKQKRWTNTKSEKVSLLMLKLSPLLYSVMFFCRLIIIFFFFLNVRVFQICKNMHFYRMPKC